MKDIIKQSGLTDDEEYAPCVEMITKYIRFGNNIDADIEKLKDKDNLKEKAATAELNKEQTEVVIDVCKDTIAVDLQNQRNRLFEKALEQIKF